MINRAALAAQLYRHEGCRLQPYRDTVGKLTIGVGRNLDDVGVSHDEALALLDHDIDRVEASLRRVFGWFEQLDPVRQQVLANMAFNMGTLRLLEFRRMLAAVQAGDFETAATEMLASKWATQVGERATELAAQMRSGL